MNDELDVVGLSTEEHTDGPGRLLFRSNGFNELGSLSGRLRGDKREYRLFRHHIFRTKKKDAKKLKQEASSDGKAEAGSPDAGSC